MSGIQRNMLALVRGAGYFLDKSYPVSSAPKGSRVPRMRCRGRGRRTAVRMTCGLAFKVPCLPPSKSYGERRTVSKCRFEYVRVMDLCRRRCCVGKLNRQ